MTKRILSFILIVTLLCVPVVNAAPKGELANLAQLGSTSVSSNPAPSYSVLSGGVDGDPDTFCYLYKKNVACSYTLDFGTAYELASVKLKNRAAGDTNINALVIEVANNADFSDAVEIYQDTTTSWGYSEGPEFDVNDSNKYRYLRLRKTKVTQLLCFADLTVMGYVTPSGLEIEKISTGDTNLSDGGTIPENADYVELDFTNNINFDLIDELSIAMTSGGEPLPFECLYDSQQRDKLTLAFKKSLVRGETLNITLDTIFDAYTQTLSGSYTFEVADAAEGSVNVINIEETKMNGGTISIQGTLLSSQNVGISGRKVEVYAAIPEGTEEYAGEFLSGENGSFVFEYTIPQGSPAGTYTFALGGDYVADRVYTECEYLGSDINEIDLVALSTTKSSSSYANYGTTTAHGVDGDLSTITYLYKSGVAPWFMVDFGVSCPITSVSLQTVTGRDSNIKNVIFEVSNDPDFEDSEIIHHDSTTSFSAGDSLEFSVSSGEKYRYLRLSKTKAGDMIIFAELKVMGWLELPEPAVSRISFDDSDITTGSVIPRGLDHMVLDMPMDIVASSINANNIALTCDGDNIPLEFENAGNTSEIIIKLKKTLSDNATVVLSVDGLMDEFSQNFTGEYTFTVGGEDKGTASTTIDKPVKESDGVKIRGVMKSSQDIGIEGRKVYLYVGAPDGSVGDAPVAETVSGKDGAYEFTYIFDEDNDKNGLYTFCTDGEYTGSKATDTYVFMNSALEMSILDSLRNTQDADDVRAVFTQENYSYMGIVPVESREVIEDYDKFYEHFAGRNYSSVGELSQEYEEYVVMEMINQATIANDIGDVISDADNCRILGISYDRILIVQEKKMRMYADILALEAAAEVEYLRDVCTEIIERYVALEAGKTDVELVDNSMSIYAGQSAELELAFLSAETSVSGAEFTITSTNADALNNAEVSLGIEGQYTSGLVDGVLTINIIPLRTMDTAQHLGTVTLTLPSDSSDYSVTMAGTVTYEVTLNSEDIQVTAGLIPRTSEVRFAQQSPESTGNKNDASTSRPSGSFGGGGGGGGGIAVTPVVPAADTVVYFTDLASSSWAEEAVNALADKGIVSISDDNMFYPERVLTREEFVKLIVMALGIYDSSAVCGFSDVDASSWYAPYVASANNAGIVAGKGDGTFGSGESITREDMAVMLVRAAGFSHAESGAVFADDAQIADYARSAVYTLRAMGIINGVSDTEFSPKGVATRAMAAKVIYEMLKEVA